MRVRLTTSVADRTLDFLLLFQFFPSGLPLRRQQHTYHLFHFPASFPVSFNSYTSGYLHINRFLIEKKLLYSNVEDSIFILPRIDFVSDYYDFSE